jgi:ankyrin repeat protein
MHMLSIFLVIFFILQISLQGMEAPSSDDYSTEETSSEEEEKEIKQVIIFGEALNYIEIAKSLLYYSEPLKAMLKKRKKHGTLRSHHFKNNVISTDLDFVELRALKKALKKAQIEKENARPYLTETEEVQEKSLQYVIKKYQIFPLCESYISKKGYEDEESDESNTVDFGDLYTSLEDLLMEGIQNYGVYDLVNLVTEEEKSKAQKRAARNEALGLEKKSFDRPPLYQAFEKDNFKKMKKLIEQHGANPFWKDEENNSLLHYAAKVPDDLLMPNLLCYLIAFCSLDPYEYNDAGYTPLHISIKSEGTEENTKFLIKQCGLDPLVNTSKGLNCLHLAILNNNPEITQFLIIECDVDPNIKSITGEMPLHYAAIAGNNEIADYLISQCNVSPDVQSEFDNTPLHYAAKIGNYGFADYLISKGANPNACNDKGISPFSLAYNAGHTETASLIKIKIKINNAIKDSAPCPVCQESIDNFAEYKRALTPCCYKFVCASDFKTLSACPLCNKKITIKERMLPEYTIVF